MDTKQLILISNVIAHAKDINPDHLEDFVNTLQKLSQDLGPDAKTETVKAVWATVFELYTKMSQPTTSKSTKK